jgi:hypothetical protein
MRALNPFPFCVVSFLFLSACGGGGGDRSGDRGVPRSDFRSALAMETSTSNFNPPSPDPTGIAYIPDSGSASGKLTIVDSAADDLTPVVGKNVFDTLLDGTLYATQKAVFSDEPTGVSLDPLTRHLFYSDDNEKRIYEVNPGPDASHHTADDTVTSFSTSAYGNNDPEDVAFDTWTRVLFVTDGASNEVYRVSPGANGRFDGIAPAGDDTVTHFDTSAFANNPEGIAFNTKAGTLYLTGDIANRLVEVTTSGDLVQTVDVSAANAIKLSGLAYAPASDGSDAHRIYLVDRGRISPRTGPTGVDGRMYEMTLPSNRLGNRPPTVNAGPDSTTSLLVSVLLDGSVGDDNLPRPGALETIWRKIRGPGRVTFADRHSADTTARFHDTGKYVLRLTADDGEARVSDDATITVLPDGSVADRFRINKGTDDAEERVDSFVARGDDELQLVVNTQGEAPGRQTVGLRYANVDIPARARIISAEVQFTTAAKSSGGTNLMIQAEASDDAGALQSTAGNISSRLRTIASVTWSPPPWNVVGASGSAERTSDLSTVVQEIVNRPGWSSGNALILIITGSGTRVAKSYNGDPADAPVLRVRYASGG